MPRLLDAGYLVRCLVRSPRKLRDRTWATDPLVEIAHADLSDLESLTTNLRGCKVAYFLVHSMNTAGAEYAERDFKLAHTFARAADEVGVERRLSVRAPPHSRFFATSWSDYP